MHLMNKHLAANFEVMSSIAFLDYALVIKQILHFNITTKGHSIFDTDNLYRLEVFDVVLPSWVRDMHLIQYILSPGDWRGCDNAVLWWMYH
ncbi:uncharacterized protein PHALS_07712 [Plasmopara halstedii]|uniref:Uncharacterized protein n=1 Tax=Plasmopara halstedii TaxID=4781 RepID=A0A0N7L8I6_PLAHL|nr:uncharacterized protein PHALS_07712 [Plasmopara halstedii]CEG49979.1 hypothetical protein PHALS_07712 [Plasmopara halstedii]|eukprot:XP_024586348.1 hypothetical protein PHALS_07712 [Plasmopara halstedii]